MPDPALPALSRAVGGAAFGLDAKGYHAARLPYPDELYEELFGRLAPRPKALEIGPGTGLVTQALLSRGVSALTAVEPDAALLAFTRRRLADPRLSMIQGAFPDVLIDGQFDLIACAAAFHWLEPERSLAKVKELLSPDGLWAMWWHSYRNPGMGDALADAVSPLLRDIALPPSASIDRHYSLDQDIHRRLLVEAGFGPVEYRLYESERELTTDAVLALYKSYSFIRVLPADQKAGFLDRLSDLVETRFGGRAPNLVLTALYFAGISK